MMTKINIFTHIRSLRQKVVCPCWWLCLLLSQTLSADKEGDVILIKFPTFYSKILQSVIITVLWRPSPSRLKRDPKHWYLGAHQWLGHYQEHNDQISQTGILLMNKAPQKSDFQKSLCWTWILFHLSSCHSRRRLFFHWWNPQQHIYASILVFCSGKANS